MSHEVVRCMAELSLLSRCRRFSGCMRSHSRWRRWRSRLRWRTLSSWTCCLLACNRCPSRRHRTVGTVHAHLRCLSRHAACQTPQSMFLKLSMINHSAVATLVKEGLQTAAKCFHQARHQVLLPACSAPDG